MSVRLTSVVCLRERDYEVTLEVNGTFRRCIGTPFEHRGVRGVEAKPDFLATLAISPRLVAAAVFAVDAARSDTSDADASEIKPATD